MRRAAILLACLAIVACNPATSSTHSISPPAGTSKTPGTAPATPAPDNESVSVGATGVGVYQLISMPVAIVHNNSTRHAAIGVVVHLAILRNGSPLSTVDANTIDIAPNQSLAVAADCTDACTGANGASGTVTVASWGDPSHVPIVTASPGAVSNGGGRGQADANATITAQHIAGSSILDVFAACFDGGGSIVGGGTSQVGWNASGSQQVSVPVIISTAVVRCDVFAAI